MGLGIIVMMILSAISDLPYSVPAILLVGTIMVLNAAMSYLCLRTQKKQITIISPQTYSGKFLIKREYGYR